MSVSRTRINRIKTRLTEPDAGPCAICSRDDLPADEAPVAELLIILRPGEPEPDLPICQACGRGPVAALLMETVVAINPESQPAPQPPDPALTLPDTPPPGLA